MICQICSVDDAKYGFKTDRKKQFCKDCAKDIPNSCNLTKKLCKDEDCIKEPTYNFPNETGAIYCTTHKQPGMIDKKHKKCQYKSESGDGCLLHPSYGIAGGKAMYCKSHGELFENMILIRNDTCKWSDGTAFCTTRASFNKEGKKVGMYCQNHKEDDMVFVLKCDTCIEPGCKTRASFNLINEKKGIYCEEHKKSDMYNVKDARCISEGCVKIASFNVTGSNTYLYCNEHKLEGMVNIKSKKCIYEGCNKLPTCNKVGETIKLYCADHREINMTNVKNSKCIEKGCFVEASCNFLGEKKRLYCCRHKKEGMIQLSAKLCKYIAGDFKCNTRANPRYNGYCIRCYVGLFPANPKTRNFKTKEVKVCEHIKEHFPDYTILFDRTIPDGCSKRRPDMYMDMGSHTIIIEVDENQHIAYDNICENKRYMEIFQDLGNRPMVLIRFNPDEYYNSKDVLVKSCWSRSRDGLAIINRNKRDEWKNRLKTLVDSIQKNIENEPNKEIEITYLYYDENKNDDAVVADE